jgi:high-affinity Fe2+/Pb2+ permease
MTTSAWIFMGIVWGVVLVMVSYSFFKLVTSKRLLKEDSQFEIPVVSHPHATDKD